MTQDYTLPGGQRAPIKRLALRAFIGSIVVSALLGIGALLSGEFGELALKVLFSSLCVSAASLCAMGGAALLESRGARLPSVPAMWLSAIGLGLVLVGIWGEVDGEYFWKTSVTLVVFAVACAHVSLLLMARLAPRFAWLRPTTWGLIFALAAYGSALLWGEADGEGFFRLLGVLSILVAALTLATPVLHRMSRDDLDAASPESSASTASPTDPVPMLCPSCAARCDQPLGDAECPRCRTRFRLVLS